jgi:hypothetical protein
MSENLENLNNTDIPPTGKEIEENNTTPTSIPPPVNSPRSGLSDDEVKKDTLVDVALDSNGDDNLISNPIHNSVPDPVLNNTPPQPEKSNENSNDNKNQPTKDLNPKTKITKQIDITVDSRLLKNLEIPNPNDEIVLKVYNSVMKMVDKKTISQDNIIEIVGNVIQTVQLVKRGKEILTNEEKKAIVINIVQRLVNESPIDETVKKYLVEIFIPSLLPGVIDSLCNLNVNKVIKSSCFCFS